MRIAIDARAYFQRTGIGRYTRGLVLAIVEANPRDRFLILISDHHAPAEIPFRDERVEVQVSRAAWLGGRGEREQVGREVGAWRADLFHSIFPPMTVRGVRSLVTVFDLTPLSHPHLHQPAVVRAFRASMPSALAKASGVAAISKATADEVRRRFPAAGAPTHVVGVGLAPLFGEVAPSAKRTGVLFVGTIEPRKNVPLVVDTARELRRRGYREPVTIVGKAGWGDFDVAAAIEGLKGVRYRGYVNDRALRALYRRAAVFFYPSAAEGFGLPVVEAMSQGALPLVSPDPALCEVVRDPTLVVDVDSPASVAEAIMRWSAATAARERKTDRLIRRARRHTWQRAARQVSRLYRERQ